MIGKTFLASYRSEWFPDDLIPQQKTWSYWFDNLDSFISACLVLPVAFVVLLTAFELEWVRLSLTYDRAHIDVVRLSTRLLALIFDVYIFMGATSHSAWHWRRLPPSCHKHP